MEKKWIIKNGVDDKIIESLSTSLNINKVLSKILASRNIYSFESAKNFFRPSLDHLHDPFLLLNMEKAVDKLTSTIHNNENILIYGDYDVDGTTAVALVYNYLKEFYSNVDFYIPDRYNEGYGISKQGIDYASDNDISLIIALDCGIKAIDKVEYANSKNIDFIICDHHLPGEELPKAYAIINPKQIDCLYPFKELSGCGVGFKFMQAFSIKNNIDIKEKLFSYLDLLTISIAADLVKITDENRVLAYFGLQQINHKAPRAGIECILELCNIKKTDKKNDTENELQNIYTKNLTISDLVFTISPRINAAGRISSGKNAVKLLTATNIIETREIANKINTNNIDRRAFDTDITEKAISQIANDEDLLKSKGTVVYGKNWHKGVLGIVASRLIETYYRPTVVLSLIDGIYTGSARSVENFDIYEAINSCSHLLQSFGGHKYAAGLSMKEENIADFLKYFEDFVSKNITEKSLIPQINIDSELNIENINFKFYNVLNQFAPFGPGNMSPVFVSRGIIDTGMAKIVGEKHLKLQVCNPENRAISFPAIGFGLANKLNIVKNKLPFDICYSIEKQEWNGNINLQLMIKDIKQSGC